MAQLDLKYLTGLAECFAKNKCLRQLCNLVIMSGIADASFRPQVSHPLTCPLIR